MNSSTCQISHKHKENVITLFNEWQKVSAESSRDKTPGTCDYIEHNPPNYKDFTPVDLEEFRMRQSHQTPAT